MYGFGHSLPFSLSSNLKIFVKINPDEEIDKLCLKCISECFLISETINYFYFYSINFYEKTLITS